MIQSPDNNTQLNNFPLHGIYNSVINLCKLTDLFDLTGKVAVVTGGAGGIGNALTLGLAESGADVAIADLELDFDDNICRFSGIQ